MTTEEAVFSDILSQLEEAGLALANWLDRNYEHIDKPRDFKDQFLAGSVGEIAHAAGTLHGVQEAIFTNRSDVDPPV